MKDQNTLTTFATIESAREAASEATGANRWGPVCVTLSGMVAAQFDIQQAAIGKLVNQALSAIGRAEKSPENIKLAAKARVSGFKLSVLDELKFGDEPPVLAQLAEGAQHVAKIKKLGVISSDAKMAITGPHKLTIDRWLEGKEPQLVVKTEDKTEDEEAVLSEE